MLLQRIVQFDLAAENFGRRNSVVYEGEAVFVFVVEIGYGDGGVEGEEFVDPDFELSERISGPDLGGPGIADHVVDCAETVVVTEEGFGEIGSGIVVEGDEFEGGIHGVAGEDSAVLEIGKEGFFEVELV